MLVSTCSRCGSQSLLTVSEGKANMAILEEEMKTAAKEAKESKEAKEAKEAKKRSPIPKRMPKKRARKEAKEATEAKRDEGGQGCEEAWEARGTREAREAKRDEGGKLPPWREKPKEAKANKAI